MHDAARKLCMLAVTPKPSTAPMSDVKKFEALADAVWKTAIVSALSNAATQHMTQRNRSITMTECVDWS